MSAMLGGDPEEVLAGQMERTLAPLGFKRMAPAPAVEAVQVSAAWRKGWPRQGVALVSIGQYIDHPGEFAAKLRRRLGRGIGYVPFLIPLGLHVVVTGRGILSRATELQLYLDTRASLTVTLQSIHVRIFTERVVDSEGRYTGYTVQVARSLTEMDRTLSTIRVCR